MEQFDSLLISYDHDPRGSAVLWLIKMITKPIKQDGINLTCSVEFRHTLYCLDHKCSIVCGDIDEVKKWIQNPNLWCWDCWRNNGYK